MKSIHVRNIYLIPALLFLLALSNRLSAQVDDNTVGAWYMYFWNTEFGGSQWGIQGDFQFRNWNYGTDLEQLLLRSGFTFRPKAESRLKLTLGYAFIQSQQYGASRRAVNESRIYQELLYPHKVGNRLFFVHRLRYEQRWVQGQNFRTRYRYNIFINIPFNQPDLNEGAWYLALYNELFLNGQKEIADGVEVDIFDRDRVYGAIGYSIKDNMRMQLGYMQQGTANWNKGQVQLSLHHRF